MLLLKIVIIWLVIGCLVQLALQEQAFEQGVKARNEFLIRNPHIDPNKVLPVTPKSVALFLIFFWFVTFIPKRG